MGRRSPRRGAPAGHRTLSTAARAVLLTAGVLLLSLGVLGMHALSSGTHGGHGGLVDGVPSVEHGHAGIAGEPVWPVLRSEQIVLEAPVLATCEQGCDAGVVGTACAAVLVGLALLVARARPVGLVPRVTGRGASTQALVVSHQRPSGREMLALLCVART